MNKNQTMDNPKSYCRIYLTENPNVSSKFTDIHISRWFKSNIQTFPQ